MSEENVPTLPDQIHVYHSLFLMRFLQTRDLQIPQNNMGHYQYAKKLFPRQLVVRLCLTSHKTFYTFINSTNSFTHPFMQFY